MKTIFTLLLSSFFTLSSLAHEGTRLTISSIMDNNLKVEINGRQFSMDTRGIYLTDLRTGSYVVRIYREKRKNNGWNVFGNGNKKQEIVYDKRINLKNGYHFDILVNRFGRVMVDERRIDDNDEWYNEEDDDYRKGRGRGNNGNRDDRNSRDDRFDNDYGRVMSDQEFRRVKEDLQREWFENNRVTTAKQIFDRNYFLSRQVKELLQLFSFENNKLDLAKYAYGRTTDKNVYYIVNDVFSLSRSRDELARYIRDYR